MHIHRLTRAHVGIHVSAGRKVISVKTASDCSERLLLGRRTGCLGGETEVERISTVHSISFCAC